MNLLLASNCDYALCTPSSQEDGVAMVKAYRSYRGTAPRLLFSDMLHSARLLTEGGTLAEGIEGVTISADPASGFGVTYRTRFGTPPLTGEAQVLDAVMMVFLADCHKEINAVDNLNSALKQVVAGRETGMGILWTSPDIAHGLIMLELGVLPEISGASGDLNFDSTVYTKCAAHHLRLVGGVSRQVHRDRL